MMHDEVVARRGWLDERRFLELLGATSLIPGPNSTEMAIHIGFARARWRGLAVAGVSFILPAALIVLALAWAYVRYGGTPGLGGALYGIAPVVIAVVLRALVRLAPPAIRGSPLLIAAGVATLGLSLAGMDELLLLFGAGAAVMIARASLRVVPGVLSSVPPLWGLTAGPIVAAVAERAPAGLWRMFLLFLKFGAVVYGSGYVLVAFLHGDLVERLGWLSEREPLDAVAVGQVTPGPVFTTATFIGYLLHGVPGAAVATAAIFLPGFVFAAALQPLVRVVRRWSWAADLIDGVTIAALALMAAVTWRLGREAVIDLPTSLLGIVAAVVLVRFELNSAWVVVAGGVLGFAITLVR